MTFGKLYLIPVPLGNDSLHTIPEYAIQIAHRLDIFIVEKVRTARRFLSASKTPIVIDTMQFFELNKRTAPEEIKHFLKPCQEGKDVGLMTEAGCPGVADPGALVVQKAHQLGIEVIPLVGPSSILLAVMASGMNGQQFTFNGYLPIKTPERIKALKRLEQLALKHNQTQVFIETPYRNNALFQDILKHLSASTLLGVACDLTLESQYIKTASVEQWKQLKTPDLHKRPVVFLLYKSAFNKRR